MNRNTVVADSGCDQAVEKSQEPLIQRGVKKYRRMTEKGFADMVVPDSNTDGIVSLARTSSSAQPGWHQICSESLEPHAELAAIMHKCSKYNQLGEVSGSHATPRCPVCQHPCVSVEQALRDGADVETMRKQGMSLASVPAAFIVTRSLTPVLVQCCVIRHTLVRCPGLNRNTA